MRRAALLLLSFLAATPAVAAEPSPILVSYSFDDGKTDTGPDTFSVFRNAKGNVQLSNAFRASGYQSVEIRDVAGDSDFPELQGYFSVRRDGWLVIHFALLVTDPEEELNIALAGPGWFSLYEDGISFWLSTRDGHLLHTTDSIPKRLLRLKPFTWYGIDADYDIVRGRYDLRIFEEGIEKPVVSLTDVPNAGAHPGSAVSMFSFIGDKGEDRSNVVYYVDDVIVATDRAIQLPPFVAPGRRQFLADVQPSPPAPLERQGDAAFRKRDLREAQRLYEEALKTAEEKSSLLLKLADVAFLRGDLASEKALREKIYGSLDPR
jgi:hypothetical protein